MKKLVYLFVATAIAGSGLIVMASQNPTESERVVIHNSNSNSNSSDYKYVKPITAQSRMGTNEKYSLYRDANDNFCVLSSDGERYITLKPYNQNGWSHTFQDGTTWFCNIY